MNAKELIEILKTLPPELPVSLGVDSGGWIFTRHLHDTTTLCFVPEPAKDFLKVVSQ